MQSLNKIVTTLLTLLFIIAIILGNFIFLLNSNDFHSSESNKFDTNKSLALNVVSFVNGKSDLDSSFNLREQTHLGDVKILFSKVKYIYYISLVLLFMIIVYLLKTKKIGKIIPDSIVLSGGITLLLLLILFILSLNFTTFFTSLHEPFFASNTWIFPSDSKLIQLFPEQFFNDFENILFVLILINSTVFLGIGLYIRKKFKRKKPNTLK
jgi:integral membrane protein (TIGR01906 family)